MKIQAVVFVSWSSSCRGLLPVRPYMDFQLIFHANLGLLRHLPMTIRPVNMIALAQVSPERCTCCLSHTLRGTR
jgi:hypothetical protein